MGSLDPPFEVNFRRLNDTMPASYLSVFVAIAI